MPGSYGWEGAGDALASQIPLTGALKAIFGRKIAKKRRSYEHARAKAAVAGAEREEAEFEQNAPIQQQALQQSLASRGVGTSSISEQDTKNLTATQARQREAVQENTRLTREGYSLYRKKRRHAKRMGPLAFWEGLAMKVGGAAAQAATGGLNPNSTGTPPPPAGTPYP